MQVIGAIIFFYERKQMSFINFEQIFTHTLDTQKQFFRNAINATIN